MSAVTKEDAERTQREGLSSTAESYSRKRKSSEMDTEEFEQRDKPFEIRVYFYQNHARSRVDPEYRKKVAPETMKEIARYYYDNIQSGRHPLIPHGTTLIKLAHTIENGKDVFYFVPENHLAPYIFEARNIQQG